MTNTTSIETFLKLPAEIQPTVSEFLVKNPGYEIIYITHYGSKLYGTNSEASDIDIKVIYKATKESLFVKNDLDHYSYSSGNDESKNSNTDIDIEFYSIHKYLGLLQKGEAGAIDLLFSVFRNDTIVYDNGFAELMRDKYKFLISKKLNSFTGYCLGQTKKYGIKGERLNELDYVLTVLDWSFDGKLEDIKQDFADIIKSKNLKFVRFVEEYNGSKDTLATYLEVLGRKFLLTNGIKYVYTRLNDIKKQYGDRSKKASEGIDYKALSHAFRIITELEELIRTGKILFPLANANVIKEIKYNKMPQEQYEDLLEELGAKVDNMLQKIEDSKIQDTVPDSHIHALLKRIYE